MTKKQVRLYHPYWLSLGDGIRIKVRVQQEHPHGGWWAQSEKTDRWRHVKTARSLTPWFRDYPETKTRTCEFCGTTCTMIRAGTGTIQSHRAGRLNYYYTGGECHCPEAVKQRVALQKVSREITRRLSGPMMEYLRGLKKKALTTLL